MLIWPAPNGLRSETKPFDFTQLFKVAAALSILHPSGTYCHQLRFYLRIDSRPK